MPDTLPLTTQEVVARLRSHQAELRSEFGLVSLTLVGSYAKGLQDAESDVDLLIETDRSLGLNFFDLEEKLQSIVQTKVDVIMKKGLRPHWLEAITESTIPVYGQE